MYKSLVFIGVSLGFQSMSGQLLAADTGDAPTQYGQATHEVVESSPWLGDVAPDDNPAFADETAEADDSDGIDDEGGVFAFATLVQNGKAYMTNVFASNPTTEAATLVAWIDFDGNGQFDVDEGVVINVPAGSENEKFKAIWPDLTNISSDYFGPSYARYRISTDQLTVADAQGSASDGEVEDFRIEILADSDGDERPDSEDLDNDNDGIPDSVEGTEVDSDGDGINDYLDTDSDNDTVPDFIEAGTNPLAPVDSDGDELPDYLDTDSDNDGTPDSAPLPDDSDQDGITDDLEGTDDEDTDSDGVANRADLDSDNDTIPDAIERGENADSPVDTDGDGIADFLDLDSDNDGITDIREANTGELDVNLIDTDNDGRVDSDQIFGTNGLVDAAETKPDSGILIFAVGDSDGDGVRDFRDLDSDNDSVFDVLETTGTDADSNGLVDSTIDNNQDGIIDGTNTLLINGPLPDTDTDFVPDFQDSDANGSDAVEPGGPGDGVGPTPGDGTEPGDGTGPVDDELPSPEGQIQTGLSGGLGCSVHNLRPGTHAAFDPTLWVLIAMSAITLMLRNALRRASAGR